MLLIDIVQNILKENGKIKASKDGHFVDQIVDAYLQELDDMGQSNPELDLPIEKYLEMVMPDIL